VLLLLNVLLDTLGAPAVAFAWMLHLSTCCACICCCLLMESLLQVISQVLQSRKAMPPHRAAVAACTPAAAAAAALAVLETVRHVLGPVHLNRLFPEASPEPPTYVLQMLRCSCRKRAEHTNLVLEDKP